MVIDPNEDALRYLMSEGRSPRRASDQSRRVGPAPTIEMRRDPHYRDMDLRVRIPEVYHGLRIPARAIENMESSESTLNNIRASIEDDVATSQRNLLDAMQASVFNSINIPPPNVISTRPRYTTTTPLQNTVSGGIEPMFNREYIRNPDMEYYQRIAENYAEGPSLSHYESPPSLQPKTREPSVIYQQIKKYIIEELELKVQTETVDGRLEIKVALVEISSGQELLESSDFTEIKDE